MVYVEFYGLAIPPFQLTPDARFFFESAVHRGAMAHMVYGLHHTEGFIIITGEIGAGKTILVDHLLSTVKDNSFVLAKIVCSQLAAVDLLHLVAAGFGIGKEGLGKGPLLNRISDFLLAQHRSGKRALLIIDEAQNLSFEALEELRMLSNLMVGQVAALQSILLGQPQFRATLSSLGLEQLRQRVTAAYHLSALNEAETAAYIEHRLRRAEWKGDPRFTEASFPVIHHYTKGVPRRINTLCSRLLLHGFLEKLHTLTEITVHKVANDLRDEIAGVVSSPVVRPRGTERPAAREVLRTPKPVTRNTSAPENATAPPSVLWWKSRKNQTETVLPKGPVFYSVATLLLLAVAGTCYYLSLDAGAPTPASSENAQSAATTTKPGLVGISSEIQPKRNGASSQTPGAAPDSWEPVSHERSTIYEPDSTLVFPAPLATAMPQGPEDHARLPPVEPDAGPSPVFRSADGDPVRPTRVPSAADTLVTDRTEHQVPSFRARPTAGQSSLLPEPKPPIRSPALIPRQATPKALSHTTPPRPAEAPANQRASPPQIAALVARGDTFMNAGDIASARLFYERAVDAGDASAALRLGATFDPDFLSRASVRGVAGDPGLAASWYRRARDGGDAAADERLKGFDPQRVVEPNSPAR